MKAFSSILIIDDDATTRFLIERAIKKAIHTEKILTASNGEEALKLLVNLCLTKECPELILLDINMPLMNGFELLQALQKSPIDLLALKIFLLTSSMDPKDLERAKSFPLAGYLQKPLTADKIHSVLAA